MAAYAALVSLRNLIEQLQHHPRPPITLDKEQVETLTQKIAFLQDFLEVYNSHYSKQEVEHLRSHIADVAYAAEDVIETHIVNRIHPRSIRFDGEGRISLRGLFVEADDLHSPTIDADDTIFAESTTYDEENLSSIYLYQGLHELIEEMDLVKKEVEEIKEKLGAQEQLQGIMTTPIVSSKSPSTQHNIMVGFDDVLNEMLHKLTGQPSDRQIIPISGMGGIGKTTLARNVYSNPLIEHHFHVLAWVTISQEYNVREILLELLCQNNRGGRDSFSQMSDAQLGEKLYKSLYGRRYLIVMDDMWSSDAWDKVKKYFPSNNDGSKIIVTTRLSNLASYLTDCCGLEMNFLDEDKSWSLFHKTVFGEEDCPLELEHIGMEIAKNCKGLPLSIVVLGGLLAKSKQTREYWEYILGNLSSIVNLEQNERYLKILRTSYEELPVHLKACFLYMGTFPEDSKIWASELIRTWVAEGFLKSVIGKSLEESGEEYLMDLIDRNLILIGERGYYKKIVFCSIHDLLRDLCLREARKEKFLFSANQHGHKTPDKDISTQRRIIVHQNTSKEYLRTLKSASVARSLTCYLQENLPLVELKLLRVFKMIDNYDQRSLDAIFQQVNLRYLAVKCDLQNQKQIPSSVSLLWNLQTLIIYPSGISSSAAVAAPEIWKMPLLRHVEMFHLSLPNPPSADTDRRDDFVLHHLHTLSGIVNLKFGEEVVKRIPNVKNLELRYDVASDYCLNNLGDLYKLESLGCIFNRRNFQSRADLLQNFIFPHSLKELAICFTKLDWDDINTKIGSLPHLQVLRLVGLSFTSSEWKTVEGQFCSLKQLSVKYCKDWEHWSVESTHFPRLEHLALEGLAKLKEIPCGVGDMPALKLIELDYCNDSVIISAKQILEEQEELGNEGLKVTVVILIKDQHLEKLASRNFQVNVW